MVVNTLRAQTEGRSKMETETICWGDLEAGDRATADGITFAVTARETATVTLIPGTKIT